jgi:hypothetical protein
MLAVAWHLEQPEPKTSACIMTYSSSSIGYSANHQGAPQDRMVGMAAQVFQQLLMALKAAHQI